MTYEREAKRIIYIAFEDNHMWRDDIIDNEFLMMTLSKLIERGHLKRADEP